MRASRCPGIGAALLIGSALAGAAQGQPRADPGGRQCDAAAAGISLPSGFCATLFADLVGVARHLVAAPNGDVYVSLGDVASSVTQIGRLRPDRSSPAILALRDTDRDGRADLEVRTARPNTATGMAFRGDTLYVAARTAIERYQVRSDAFGILGTPDTIVAGLPEGGHNSKSLALGAGDDLYVSVGSYSNACRASRNEGAPDPCPELAVRAGIWRYSAQRIGQRHPADGERWATGVRNGLGLYWHAGLKALFGTSHGRDGLATIFPRVYTIEQNADTPSEEFFRVDLGSDVGWPYCFHDRGKGKKVLAPEYGGDGSTVGRCAGKTEPLVGFPGHWAPNAMTFYTGTMFPTRYRDGAFIAFHGSWNRQPLPEDGYVVVFQPMRAGRPTGPFEVFADGFAEGDKEPVRAAHRPTGLAQGPDGALLVSDDQRGRIWRVVYRSGS